MPNDFPNLRLLIGPKTILSCNIPVTVYVFEKIFTGCKDTTNLFCRKKNLVQIKICLPLQNILLLKSTS
jgi:hypothetical protein